MTNTPSFDAVTIEIFKHLFASAAEEMGITLGRTAYSPNIKERLDHSCAVFLGDGRMLAQAAHIPVHLGAMPASVKSAIQHASPFSPGDVVILNDPYLGGTHLPDITMVSPVFISDDIQPDFFVASRAHHSDIGGMSPGSMPLSTELYQEGIIIPPIKLVAGGVQNQAVFDLIVRNSRMPEERLGDLNAQEAAHLVGERRLRELVETYGIEETQRQAENLITYAERLTRSLIADLPDGDYRFEDQLDNDGISPDPIPIRVRLEIAGDQLHVDFTGTSAAVTGSVNAVPAIVWSGVGYMLRCIAGEGLPFNEGVFAPVTLTIPAGSLLDPGSPHAVAGGNVETSMRIVDTLFGAMAKIRPDLIPAASQGTMNNFTFGGIDPDSGRGFAYYETIGGGSGASPIGDGASGIHCHMSNTLNTPIEALELSLPIRVERYALRDDSGGEGKHRGGDGLIRDIRFLAPARVTLLTDRRERGAYGLAGGSAGEPGENVLYREDGTEEKLLGKASFDVKPGDVVSVKSPGGGGWGES